ncbi:histidine kinase [Mucilaginibacter sp. ZT4R22]|uniref:Histidine kinase n=1 Tax=Mucilaginibacter pankratovii TaxID=2772110 RepID=A0ABR7WME5_9SPHI|nr:histidine kinase [Mucilaginibacter pankratovii]MBD1363348.1 histidine kinase [Mucilaginibacter pankratovii]
MKRSITISLYWKCQLIGWSIAALYWGYAGYSPKGFNWMLGVIQFSTDVFIYILITHLYRNFALSRGWQNLGLNKLLPRLVPAVLVLGLVYLLVTSVKIYYIRLWLQPDISRPFGEFFDFYRDGILVAGIRLMSIWLLAYHLYHYSQREISIAKENGRLAVITRDAQLNNLSAQLNPHFLFNSLNNIKALISDDPTSARRAIDLLSELLRSSLYHGDKQLISLKEELGLVRDYLELEKLRFEERLQYHIADDDLSQNILLPRLSIQTLTENAVKHGISKQKNGGLIAIHILKVDGYLNITVSNPGKFTPAAESHGLGLKNLNERLQLHYQNAAAFNINETGGTVSATIKIPLA